MKATRHVPLVGTSFAAPTVRFARVLPSFCCSSLCTFLIFCSAGLSPAPSQIIPVDPPIIDFPQPFPVGDHIDATTSVVLRTLMGEYAPPPPPDILTVLPRTTVKFSLPVADADIASVTWFKDRRALPVTDTTLLLENVASSAEGFYTATIRRKNPPEVSPAYADSFETINLRVGTARDLKFLNLSSRTTLAPGNPTLISGLVVAPRPHDPLASKTVLFRAVGPSLAKLGVKNPLARPMLKIFNQDGSEYMVQFGYPAVIGGLTPEQHLANATQRSGAFALDDGAADAVQIRPMLPGVYTVHVNATDAGTGDVLLEIYEVPDDDYPPPPPYADLPIGLPPVSPDAAAHPASSAAF
jgi:hypothetical protein